MLWIEKIRKDQASSSLDGCSRSQLLLVGSCASVSHTGALLPVAHEDC